MSEDAEQPSSSSDVHFCVFVHGLWGNPGHLTQVSKALQNQFEDSNLHILVAKRNVGNFTYDGIELGAERVTKEIEDEIEEVEKQGKNITKISVIGYSLGGLIARYAIGLLYSNGYFERMQPINFTTFATPHLGTRTPLLGWASQVFNNLGSRTLSASGQQLWTTDDFQGTGRPILDVLADPNSVFIRALSAFKTRMLYANIVNDRAVPFYTACIEDVDPFVDIDDIHINYTLDTDDVILQHPHGDSPYTSPMAIKRTSIPTYWENVANGAKNAANKAPFYFFLTVLGPIGASVFLTNAGIQSFKSATRIQDHAEGKGGIEQGRYKVQLMLEQAQRQAEKVMTEEMASRRGDYLPEGETGHDRMSRTTTQEKDNGEQKEVNDITGTQPSPLDRSSASKPTHDLSQDGTTTGQQDTTSATPSTNGHPPAPAPPKTTTQTDDALAYGEDTFQPRASTSKDVSARPSSDSRTPTTYPNSLSSQPSPTGEIKPDFPTLALTPEQFRMKASLDAVGWKKYPVHIKRANHSHAAIIVRMQRPGFGEGRTVAKHWVERFEI